MYLGCGDQAQRPGGNDSVLYAGMSFWVKVTAGTDGTQSCTK